MCENDGKAWRLLIPAPADGLLTLVHPLCIGCGCEPILERIEQDWISQ